MESYNVHLVVKNKYGEFIGKLAIIDEERYDKLVEMSKTFYIDNRGFELTCEDESFIIFPPEIVKESILIIKKEKINKVK